MSVPAEALFSQMGDLISKKRNNRLQPPKRMTAFIKSLGFIQDYEIPSEYQNIEDNGTSPDDLSEERKSAEAEVSLTIDDIKRDKKDVDISTAPHVFRELVHEASCFS